MDDARKEIKDMVIDTTQKVLNRELAEEERTRYSDAATKELAGNN